MDDPNGGNAPLLDPERINCISAVLEFTRTLCVLFGDRADNLVLRRVVWQARLTTVEGFLALSRTDLLSLKGIGPMLADRAVELQNHLRTTSKEHIKMSTTSATPSMSHVAGTFYIVRSDEGLKKAVEQHLTQETTDSRTTRFLEQLFDRMIVVYGYPQNYPALVAFGFGYEQGLFITINELPLSALKGALLEQDKPVSSEGYACED